MIIVSQDKELIVNFSNITAIFINSQNEIAEINNFEPLGKYKTKERAKEVLQEIVQAIVDNRKLEDAKDLFGYSIIPSNTLYVMPKE